MDQIIRFLKEFYLAILLGLVGVVIFGYGLWRVAASGLAGEERVEIVKGGKSSEHLLTQGSELMEVVVDVSGAVKKPGAHKLASGSRIGDALLAAGGLSENSDREWVSKTINLAKVVEDGEKVYIPSAQTTSGSGGQRVGESENQIGQISQKININTASLGELDKLTGIGEVRAGTIIENRPYGKLDELVSKAKIPQSVYDKIKDSLSIY